MHEMKRVADEFGRQAETFDAWATKTDERVEARFRDALGAAGRGDLLDVACGPGVVTAAIAPGAASVVALDAAPAMLDRARARCARSDLGNVAFEIGDAHALPFADARFDGVVSRLAVHHFSDPGRAIDEMARVLRPGGVLAIADIVVSEDAAEADLQNAIERLRDPTHTRMLTRAELERFFAAAGLADIDHATWDKPREFEEWMAIVNEPSRTQPLRTVVRALAEDGRSAGMGLRLRDERIVFFHRWCRMTGRKPN